MSAPELSTGLIIRAQSGFFFVLSAEQTQPVTCQLRGRLKQGRHESDLAAVGDLVKFTQLSDGSGSIEEILPRKSEIVRLDPRLQGEYRQILLANPDQAVFRLCLRQPRAENPHVGPFLGHRREAKRPGGDCRQQSGTDRAGNGAKSLRLLPRFGLQSHLHLGQRNYRGG